MNVRNKGMNCCIAGCGQLPFRKRLCNMHYRRIRKSGNSGPPERLKAEYVGGPVNSSGYVLLSGYRDHPNSQSNGKILEHVLVMSKMVGRPIMAGETVHHKNGIRTDNRPDNLELWVSRHPPGQRLEDIRKFVSEFIHEYGLEMEAQF